MDLIDRQEVDKIIDDLLENDNLQASPSVWHGLHMIKQLPSAQPKRCEDCENFSKTRLLIPQSKIIRCKDCKYMTEHYDTDGNAPYWTCSEWDSGTDYDGFCHYAERRTDETD